MNKKKLILLILIISTLSPLFFSGCFETHHTIKDSKPLVNILYPRNNMLISNIVLVTGNASDPDGNNTLVDIEVKIDDSDWDIANGITNWSYDFGRFVFDDGYHLLSARAWDGKIYSDIKEVNITIDIPEELLSSSHKWAIFIAADNSPKNNLSKLGNGGLYLAENMSSYFIENYDFSTSNIHLLFDDGWIRSDNGYGNPIQTLQERPHKYDIKYGSATKKNIEKVIQNVKVEANKYNDSEVFIWIFSHGYGNPSKPITGGKILQESIILLWNNSLTDNELGILLSDLQSKKTCVIIDSCYSSGFADKIIYNLPELFLLKSDIAKPGRIIISGTSKFRTGYAITTLGPVFSLIWFDGLKSRNADGFRPGFFHRGRPTIDTNGEVTVEEAFYYTSYVLRNNRTLVNFSMMEPQMNDQYPGSGPLKDIGGMVL